jgi:hypothetical protein
MMNTFLNKLIEWLLRRKSPALMIFRAGLAVVLAVLAIGYAFSLRFPLQGGLFELSWNTGGGAADWLAWAAFAFGAALMVVGIVWERRREHEEARRLERKRVIAIELRGLREVADAPLSEAVPADLEGRREPLLVDLRRWVERGTVTDPEAALQAVALLPHDLSRRYQGLDRRDVSVAFGGLAAVPLTFLAGMLVDDESQVTVLDWDREASRWRVLDGPDDGDRFVVQGIDRVPANAPDTILAASVSYKVDVPAVRATLGDLPLVELELPNGTPSCHWSEQKQRALAQAFRDTVIALGNRRIGRIHTVIAAQSSVAFRFGRSYDRRNLPPLIVYQYERSSTPPYPWGIIMPTHGLATPAIFRPVSPAVATAE